MQYKITDLVKLAMLMVLGRDTSKPGLPFSMTYSYLVGGAKDLLYTLDWIKEDVFRNQAYNLPSHKKMQHYVVKLDSGGYKATDKLIEEYEIIEAEFEKYLKIFQKYSEEGPIFSVSSPPIDKKTLGDFNNKYSEIRDLITSTFDNAEQLLKHFAENGDINNETFNNASKVLALKYYFGI